MSERSTWGIVIGIAMLAGIGMVLHSRHQAANTMSTLVVRRENDNDAGEQVAELLQTNQELFRPMRVTAMEDGVESALPIGGSEPSADGGDDDDDDDGNDAQAREAVGKTTIICTNDSNMALRFCY